jgi:peptidoglycan/xylan/chitin deacetylase (PgdA/CDA1 family)/glycosyltransferase involved in cell wall biosynthesis
MRFSIIIPTHNRRDLVTRNVEALEQQALPDFNVIVSVDGSVDGTAAALRRINPSFSLTVIEQTRQGAAAARNAGAAIATGELLLFLDDDMEADSALLLEHDRQHRAGADVVLGHLPVHPGSPVTVLTPSLLRWSERRLKRLSEAAPISPADMLTGQLSISRQQFQRVGRFDPTFTAGGAFGGEDVDFGLRAQRMGLRVVFSAAAISHQYYDVDLALYTRRSRQAARTNEELRARHPEKAREPRLEPHFSSPGRRRVFGFLAAAPAAVSWPLRALTIWLVDRPEPRGRSRTLFLDVQAMERRRGELEGRRALGSRLAAVLAYHSISDLHGDPVIAEYGVPPARFAAQLDALRRVGWRFVSLEALIAALEGRAALPKRAVLVTFDDAYADVLTAAEPLLADRQIPAVVFALSERLGATNTWDQALGARELPLLGPEGLLELSKRGVAIGSHGATHRRMVGLEPRQLDEEVRASAAALTALGLPRPAALSYPYGVHDAQVRAAVAAAGYSAGFTVVPGVVRRSGDRYAIPRIEVFARDSPRLLPLKIAAAGWPKRVRRRLPRQLGGQT